jgi:membrane protease YdiL (CAAX protease family)
MHIGLVLWTLFFAYGHMMQGIDNAAGAGALGLIFGLLYIWRRNLVAPIVAHAAYDVTTLIIYWEFLRS